MATHQSASMMAVVYRIVLWLALPLVWVRLSLRARREPEYGQRRAERFGRVPGHIRPGCIWFHTVSAGETIAAAPLIQSLAQNYHQWPFLVTTMTPTGSQQVTDRLTDWVDHCYAPYDFMFAVKRFFDAVQPRLLVLMETELWPNLIGEAHRRGVPVLLVNARLSERSARGYGRVASLARPMLQQLDFIACQSEAHAQRFVELGAAASTTQALGSVKYDVALPDGFEQQVATLNATLGFNDRPVWIAASTHPGEDEIVLQAFTRVRQQHAELCLLLVPRHPVRADEVEALVRAQSFSVHRQSNGSTEQTVDVVLGDVMGTLLQLYGLADVAFVGGSLVPVGGHNPLEPALCSLPILCGPEQFNFTEVMVELEQRGALRTVAGVEDLATAVSELLSNQAECAAMGSAALTVLTENRGATARVKAVVAQQIEALTAVDVSQG